MSAFHGATLYTTLSCCPMFKMKQVVIGENINYRGPEELLQSNGVEVVVLNTDDCVRLTQKLIAESPEKWRSEVY